MKTCKTMAPYNDCQRFIEDAFEDSDEEIAGFGQAGQDEDLTFDSTLIPIFARLYKDLPATQEGRVLFISRHGESLYNLENKIGGNPGLSPQGLKYARALGAHVNSLNIHGLKVWTSQLLRTHQTAEDVDAPKVGFHELNELDSGSFDHLTYEEFEKRYPAKFKEREDNKLTFRYPEGESYVDVCRRLEPLLPSLDSEHNVLVVSHQAVIRCLLAFLLRLPGKDVPYIKVPLHCILKVTCVEGGENSIEYHHLPISCVDTYRPKSTKQILTNNKQHATAGDKEKTSKTTITEDAVGVPNEGDDGKKVVLSPHATQISSTKGTSIGDAISRQCHMLTY